MNTIARIVLAAGVASVVACGPPPPPPEAPDTRAEDAAAIRATVEAWSAAAQAKDAEKFLTFYTDDAVFLAEGQPDARGIAALREAIGGMMQDPNFALSFQDDTVEVARSGDLAYETGGYTLTMSDAEQKPATQRGHYVVIWKKQADGAWKAAVDAPVSDPG
jgi:uncharacterized protein (TIGR02246 family)